MKILFIAAEATPIVKVGGLADVVGALPSALMDLGQEVRVMLPNYDAINHDRYPIVDRGPSWDVTWRGRRLSVTILIGRLPDARVTVYFLDCPAIFQTQDILHGLRGVYANSNDPEILEREIERFTFFSLVGAQAIAHLDWLPEIVHCHDWHTALIPAALERMSTKNIPTVLTIHNLQNQGRWSAAEIFSWLGWTGHESPALERRDRHGDFNTLQQGIIGATTVNTVSPTYAREILTPEFGEGLETDLARRHDVVGILNGIDVARFNPAADPSLAVRYDRSSWTVGKAENKRRVQTRLGLTATDRAPLFVSVGRFAPQKGFDLISQALPKLLAQGGQVALLGSGLPDIEKELQAVAAQHATSVAVTVGFDAVLAQQLYAAADFFLMPSRFEPCGLGQMIAMRYGAIPIVRDTGGLHDSVIDVAADYKNGTGLVFQPYSAAALEAAIGAALQLYHQPDIVHVVDRAMAQDFSWTASARRYQQLYAQTQKLAQP